MSKFKKEYSILPQNEGDDYQHHIRTNEPSSRRCFLIPLIAVTIMLILSGVVTLSISLFFPQTFSQVVHWSRQPHPGVANEKDGFLSSTTVTTNERRSTTTVGHKTHGGHGDTDLENFSPDLSSERAGDSSSTEYYSDDSKDDSSNSSSVAGVSNDHENIKEESSISGSPPANYSHDDTDKNSKNSSWINTEVELVRKVEHDLESMTGMIPELLIPLFMLICFMTSLTIVSLCCCIMMKRKDNRRRKMFGKIITDLQTGDSKTVLLNQDMDD